MTDVQATQYSYLTQALSTMVIAASLVAIASSGLVALTVFTGSDLHLRIDMPQATATLHVDRP